jgi:hypothetical protein
MPSRRHTRRDRPRPEDVPDKPGLEIPKPPEIEEDKTEAPDVSIPSSRMGRLETGTNPYFMDDETADEPKLYGRIKLPGKDSLVIDLVRSDLVYQLEEYRADGSWVAAVFWAIVGGIISILTNWATSWPTSFTDISKFFISILVAFGILIGLYMLTLHRRVFKKKKEIEQSKTPGSY